MTREKLIELAVKFKQDTNNKDFDSIPHLMADFYLFMVAPQRPNTEKEVISCKIIDRLATLLKEHFIGSNDYLSGVNDGVYTALHHCLDKKITLPIVDVRKQAQEFVCKMSKEPSNMSLENMLVKFYADLHGVVKRISTQEESK